MESKSADRVRKYRAKKASQGSKAVTVNLDHQSVVRLDCLKKMIPGGTNDKIFSNAILEFFESTWRDVVVKKVAEITEAVRAGEGIETQRENLKELITVIRFQYDKAEAIKKMFDHYGVPGQLTVSAIKRLME